MLKDFCSCVTLEAVLPDRQDRLDSAASLLGRKRGKVPPSWLELTLVNDLLRD